MPAGKYDLVLDQGSDYATTLTLTKDGSAIIGNSPLNWTGRFLTDDYGTVQYESYTIYEWEEQFGGVDGKSETKFIEYESTKVPQDVVVPDNKISVEGTRRIVSDDYDHTKEYVSRELRDEWNIIGLLGQIPITKGQPVADSWIKMKDVSDTVEMWFVK